MNIITYLKNLQTSDNIILLTTKGDISGAISPDIREYAMDEYERRFETAMNCTRLDADFREKISRALKSARQLARMIVTFLKYSEDVSDVHASTDRDSLPKPLLDYYKRLAEQYTRQMLE